jgi:hypothetical protein
MGVQIIGGGGGLYTGVYIEKTFEVSDNIYCTCELYTVNEKKYKHTDECSI